MLIVYMRWPNLKWEPAVFFARPTPTHFYCNESVWLVPGTPVDY